MAHKFEIYRDRNGEYRARFKYNSEVIFSTEGYTSKSSALNAIESIKKFGPGSPEEDPVSEADDLRRRLERAPIPAADRVVRIDHNSAEFKEFKAAFQKLEQSIRKSNDLGDMSPEEVDVAKAEIAQIGREKQRQWARPAHIWQVAKSTLLWICQQAANTVVGNLALSALAALAALLGIIF